MRSWDFGVCAAADFAEQVSLAHADAARDYERIDLKVLTSGEHADALEGEGIVIELDEGVVKGRVVGGFGAWLGFSCLPLLNSACLLSRRCEDRGGCREHALPRLGS